jgi:hypothetical protein
LLAKGRKIFTSILSTVVCLSNHFHIVCLDAPSPPDYGGAIDMYYKIKALAETGKKIILHYFDYNSLRNANGLEDYCESIYTYKRKSVLNALPFSQPFIVQSRINQELIQRLNNDNLPVLLEGLHCSGIVPFLNNNERVIIRMHNEEASYYQHLAKTEHSFLKRKYFLQESNLLKRYQQTLKKDVKLACLSETDIEVLRDEYGFKNTHFVPCFIPWQKLSIKDGVGEYCLYHGNMQVSENEEAAVWLIQNVFSKLSIPFMIAGKGVSKKLTTHAKQYKHISLISNPTIDEINELVQNAQVNVLPSMNNTGVKLKLLNALLNGRHCIANSAGVSGSRINQSVVLCNEANEWRHAIKSLMEQSFTAKNIEERKLILELYNNQVNAKKLSALL